MDGRLQLAPDRGAPGITGKLGRPNPDEDAGVDSLDPAAAADASWLGANGVAWAVGWFPAADYAEALQRWPDLGELWSEIPHEEYCRRMEATLRGWSTRAGNASLVELALEEYVPWCALGGHNPAESRDLFAADKLRRGEVRPWPPGRNEPCWCSSGSKYKRCCGTVSAVAIHPLEPSLESAA